MWAEERTLASDGEIGARGFWGVERWIAVARSVRIVVVVDGVVRLLGRRRRAWALLAYAEA